MNTTQTYQTTSEEADSLFERALADFQNSDFQAALEKLKQALPLYQQANDGVGEAKTLVRMGLIYDRLEDFPLMLIHYERAIPLLEASKNYAGEAIVHDSIAEHYRSLGDYDRALEHLRQARQLWKAAGDYPADEANSIEFTGLIYLIHLEKNQQAFDYFKEALPLWQEANRQESGTLLLLANTASNLGKYQEAFLYYNQALSIARLRGDQAEQALISNQIALFYSSLTEQEQEIYHHHQALIKSQALDSRPSQANTYIHLAQVYQKLEQFAKAIEYYKQALSLWQAEGNRAEEAKILTSLGLTYRLQGDNQKALDSVKQALDFWQSQPPSEENLLNQGHAYCQLSGIYLETDEGKQAFSALDQAIRICQKMPINQKKAILLHSIALRYHLIGIKVQMSILIRRHHLNRSGWWKRLKEVILSFAKQERFGEVEGQLLEHLYQKALEYDTQALAIYKEMGDLEGTADTLTSMGLTAEALGDLPQALDFYRQSIDCRERVRGAIHVDEFKTGLAERSADAYERAVVLLMQLGEPLEAFKLSERARARTMLDQLANKKIDFRTGADAELLTEGQLLQEQISARRAQLIELHNQPSDRRDNDACAAHQTKLKELEIVRANWLQRLKAQSPEAASLFSTEVAELEEIQSRLDQATLVEYFVAPEQLIIFIISSEKLEALSVAVGGDTIAETIKTFRNLDLSDPFLADSHPDRLQKLYEWLIVPLQPYLETRELIIVPHNVLHYLPFAALTDGERYLHDDYILSTLPSASLLRFVQEKRKPEAETMTSSEGLSTCLALGNPLTRTPMLRDLPDAEQEAKIVAALYGTQALIGPSATKRALSQASHKGILHIAAHGQYNPSNPLFSTIYLAADDQNDGRLEVHEIYGLDLTATDLVVLSACQTQVGKLSGGDEVVGLNRAFLYAGTPTVIASLWNVDDAATAQLMKLFYTHLRAGMGKAEALRQAQIETRANYPHPYYWAAFVLTGDGGNKESKAAYQVCLAKVNLSKIAQLRSEKSD